MLSLLSAGAITAYQRYLSPRKNFHCAWRIHTGRCSCAEFARRIVLRYGFWVLCRALPRQFARCRHAYEAMQVAAHQTRHTPQVQGEMRSPRAKRHCADRLNGTDLLFCAEVCEVLPCEVLPCGL